MCKFKQTSPFAESSHTTYSKHNPPQFGPLENFDEIRKEGYAERLSSARRGAKSPTNEVAATYRFMVYCDGGIGLFQSAQDALDE